LRVTIGAERSSCKLKAWRAGRTAGGEEKMGVKAEDYNTQTLSLDTN